MSDLYNPVNAYSVVSRKIMKILLPYEKHLKVMVKQGDSLCLYTPDGTEDKSEFFAAVQIISSGVAFTVYNPGAEHNILECLPARLRALYKGENKFVITKIGPGLIAEIKALLLALFGIYSLGRFYRLQETDAADRSDLV